MSFANTRSPTPFGPGRPFPADDWAFGKPEDGKSGKAVETVPAARGLVQCLALDDRFVGIRQRG